MPNFAQNIGKFWLLTLLIAIFTVLPLHADQQSSRSEYLVKGIVRDSINDDAIPQASVLVAGKTIGTLTDNRGLFEMTIPNGVNTLVISSQGYKKKTLHISKNRVNVYVVYLEPEAITLNEVVVRKQKYTKKNNPAVDFMKKIRSTAANNDPERHEFYNYDKYERISIAINDFSSKSQNSTLFKRFPFLWEHVDTSEVSGKPILNVSVKETASKVYNRRNPRMSREVVTGLNRNGIDEITDQESMQTFLEDVLREINLYDKDINLLQNRFVSPLSPIAADFYKFYLGDTIDIDGVKCVTLSFYPHNKAAFGFMGQMFVEPGDSTMFIKKVTMRVPDDINLNFIEKMLVNQEFERAPDGSRLKTRDDLVLEVKVVGGTPGLYIRRNSGFANHNFDRQEDESEIFKALAPRIVENKAYSRDTLFWQEARLIEIPHNEGRVDVLMNRLRSVKLYYWGERVIKALFSGYVATGKPSFFDVGPLNTAISTNDLEGLRLRAGGMTTANLSPRWFTRFYGAYGFRDHKWKYGLELEYSFIDKRVHSREFPVHSIRFNSSYDIDQLGQSYFFTNPDNIFIALKRLPEHDISYKRLNKLTYTLELENNFSVCAEIANERQSSSLLLQFDVDGKDIRHFDESWINVELRYAPGEKFYQTRTYRIPINLDSPVLVLSHRWAPKTFGSRYEVNRTEFSIMKRFWFSAFGYLDAIARCGHVWSHRTPYTQLLIPNANLSYTIQPESFALMNALEFVTDTYASWDLTYWANGAILNYIPYLKKLKLREVFSYRGFWGKLSDNNNPLFQSGLISLPAETNIADVSRNPYMECSVGIDNLFKCLRVDYVWRLTHRYPGYRVDRSGLRIAVHVTF